MNELCALLVSASLLTACQSAPAPGETEPESPAGGTRQGSSVAVTLSPSCLAFLSQLDCWLVKAGNEPAQVAEAVGAARALLETKGPPGASADESSARCERAMAFRRTTYRQAGCEGVVLDTSAIPRAHLVTCPADQHFFVRSDGRVAGCHPDCTTNKDCPSGSTCWAIGSAPGGPIDEPFCE